MEFPKVKAEIELMDSLICPYIFQIFSFPSILKGEW